MRNHNTHHFLQNKLNCFFFIVNRDNNRNFHISFTNWGIFTFFFLLSLIIFHKSLSVFFFQDDFFLISLSRANSLKDFMTFFVPRNDVIYFRPISLQMFYFFMFKLFGMKLIYYHLFQ